MGDRTRWSIEFERARQARGVTQQEIAKALEHLCADGP